MKDTSDTTQPNDETTLEEELELDEFLDEEGVNDTLEGQIKKLKAKLKLYATEKQENLDGWQRMRADYANLKKEFEHKKPELIKFGAEKIVYDLLQVADSFKLAFADKTAWETTPENWRKGIEYIYNQLESILGNHGVKRIDALGQKFDPLKHEALEAVDTLEPEEDQQIIGVMKEGYTFHDRVLRPAQVKIAIYKN